MNSFFQYTQCHEELRLRIGATIMNQDKNHKRAHKRLNQGAQKPQSDDATQTSATTNETSATGQPEIEGTVVKWGLSGDHRRKWLLTALHWGFELKEHSSAESRLERTFASADEARLFMQSLQNALRGA